MFDIASISRTLDHEGWLCAGYDDPNCGMYSEDEEDFIGSDEEDDEDREAYNVANWQHTHPDWAARPALAVPHLVHVRRRS